MFKYNKYDVIFGEFPDVDGSTQSGYRPAIVKQNNIGIAYSLDNLILFRGMIFDNLAKLLIHVEGKTAWGHYSCLKNDQLHLFSSPYA